MFSYFKAGRSDWTVRRRLVIFSLMFFAWVIVHSLIWVEDTNRANNAINQAMTIGGSILVAYIFGAVMDDRFKAQFGAGLPSQTTTVQQTTVQQPYQQQPQQYGPQQPQQPVPAVTIDPPPGPPPPFSLVGERNPQ